MECQRATLIAMCQQEITGYGVENYLNTLRHPDDSSRRKMAAWFFQVVDLCKFQRETASIAMSYLDRFLMKSTSATVAAARNDVKMFQLVAMTCLYTAVKTHEVTAMDPTFISNLSRGTYTDQQVVDMEATLLQTLQWRMNPPTPLAFCRQILATIPASAINSVERNAAYDLAKYQTELVVGEDSLVGTAPSSTVAFCSVMNALESLGSLEDKTLTQISYNLATAMNIHCDNSALVQVQNFLLNNALDTTTTELPIVGTYQTTANVQQQEVAADDVNIKNCFLSAERGIQTISPACSPTSVGFAQR